MARSINVVTLVGRVGRVYDQKRNTKGQQRYAFSLGTDVCRSLSKVPSTEWHTVVGWGKVAELCEKNIEVGMTVSVEGPLRCQLYAAGKGKTGKNIHVEIRSIVFMNRALVAAALHLGGPPDENEFTEESFTGFEGDEDDRPL